jgi:hemerythrin-like domain-containing protein
MRFPLKVVAINTPSKLSGRARLRRESIAATVVPPARSLIGFDERPCVASAGIKVAMDEYSKDYTDKENGCMNGLELLKEDHRKVQELFELVKATESERQRKQLYMKIKPEIETHTYIEEKVLYPALKKYEEFKEAALEAVEEHSQVKTLLREIDRLPEGSERFVPKLMVLIESVNHHIGKEEGEMFPKIEGRFSGGQLEQMGRELEIAKKEFGTKPRVKAASSR